MQLRLCNCYPFHVRLSDTSSAAVTARATFSLYTYVHRVTSHQHIHTSHIKQYMHYVHIILYTQREVIIKHILYIVCKSSLHIHTYFGMCGIKKMWVKIGVVKLSMAASAASRNLHISIHDYIYKCYYMYIICMCVCVCIIQRYNIFNVKRVDSVGAESHHNCRR